MSNKKIEKILVAEDSTSNRNILCHFLKKLGYEVSEAKNGREAREFLEKDRSYSLVLSDIMMPEENGIDLLKYVREIDGLKEMPFILVTALAEKEYIMTAKEYNVSGHVLKPINYNKLTIKLKEIFPDKIFDLKSA